MFATFSGRLVAFVPCSHFCIVYLTGKVIILTKQCSRLVSVHCYTYMNILINNSIFFLHHRCCKKFFCEAVYKPLRTYLFYSVPAQMMTKKMCRTQFTLLYIRKIFCFNFCHTSPRTIWAQSSLLLWVDTFILLSTIIINEKREKKAIMKMSLSLRKSISTAHRSCECEKISNTHKQPPFHTI